LNGLQLHFAACAGEIWPTRPSINAEAATARVERIVRFIASSSSVAAVVSPTASLAAIRS
jgi:hypothetical protein